MTDYTALLRELTRRIDANPGRKRHIIQEYYAELQAQGDTKAADHIMYVRAIMGEPEHSTLKTLRRTGIGFGVLTIVFFMAIVLLSVAEKVVPPAGKFALVAVLALGSAFASGAWIGSMALSGEINAFENQKPITVGAVGGFAVFVLVFLLGYLLYIK